ncbi:MAG TPA: hypothetical protein VL359_09840 [bacterium]|nr:hypothetical protein [bacterium]
MIVQGRGPRPATLLQTHLGRLAARQGQLRLGLLVSLATLAVLGATVLVLALALVKKPLTYITVSGVERAGIVSPATAEDFARDVLHWMFTFTWASIQDRDPYLVPRICPELVASALADLDAEAAEVRRHAVAQSISFEKITALPAPAGADFAFAVQLNRTSQVLGTRTAYDETYTVALRQQPNNDGTLRLCLSQVNRLASKILTR